MSRNYERAGETFVDKAILQQEGRRQRTGWTRRDEPSLCFAEMELISVESRHAVDRLHVFSDPFLHLEASNWTKLAG